MSCSQNLITAILVCSFIFSAGCTGSAGSAAPATPASSPVTLKSLVLSPSEVPQNFTLIESREKNSSDVSRLARDLGWKEGYVVRFSRPVDGERGPTWILQTSTRYPEKNIAAVAELIERQDRADNTMIYSNLSSPGLGSYSSAFSAKVNPLIVPEPGNQNLLVSGPGEESIQQDFVEIIFAKGDVLEVLRMSGPGADYSTLASLAKQAYNKIA